MATAQFEIEARSSGEDERVFEWRFEELTRAGYDMRDASRLAKRLDIDLHVAVQLLLAGCPQETALRILL